MSDEYYCCINCGEAYPKHMLDEEGICFDCYDDKILARIKEVNRKPCKDHNKMSARKK